VSQDSVASFARLARRALEAVGCRVEVAEEDGAAVIRDVIVEFGPTIICSRASSPDEPFMSFPPDAVEAAAAAVVVDVLKGIVSRAVETESLRS